MKAGILAEYRLLMPIIKKWYVYGAYGIP